MTTIYKISTPQIFQELVPPAIQGEVIDLETPVEMTQPDIPPVSVYVDVKPEYFEIKVYNDIKTLYWHKVPLTALKTINNKGFVDQSLWSVSKDDMFSNVGNGEAMEVHSAQLYDVFAETFNSKFRSGSRNEYYQIFVPFTEGADMTDFQYRIVLDTFSYHGKTIECVIDPTSPSKDSVVAEPLTIGNINSTAIANIEATTTATSLVEDGTNSVEVTVTTLSGISTVYLEQVRGIINTTRVPLTNGVGKFKIMSLGLSAGDVAEVKLGFKKWTNKTTFTIPVTAQ
jgi:hypothetical protein